MERLMPIQEMSQQTIEYKTLDVTARVEADINDGRARSQYRLLFPIPTDSDSLRDAAFFTSANCCTNNFPELVVTYQVPTAPQQIFNHWTGNKSAQKKR